MFHGFRWARHAAASCLCLAGLSAQAHALSFLSTVQSGGLGSQATVAVWVSDVLPDCLGAHDIDVTFDPGAIPEPTTIALVLGTSLAGDRPIWRRRG